MLRIPLFAGLSLMLASASAYAQSGKIVIAHRGASGYLPEHTLEAKAMAYGMGAHYIEQDLVMTRDDRVIVLHDITLDRTTDVADRFPGRARADGRYYAIDFDLEEIRQLQATEGFRLVNGEREPGFENRFPLERSDFRVPTFEEEIELIQGLNHSTGRDVGIYPEIKQPEFHRAEGKDISSAVVEVLKNYGYTEKSDKVFLQTFSYPELEIINSEIMPAAGIDIRLIQLLRDTESYPWIFEAEGMRMLAEHADGIGPAHPLVIDPESAPGALRVSALVERAHAAGLDVHPYTFRADPGQLPAYAENFADLLEQHFFTAGVDGLFTDFPDLAVQFLQSR
ncbi:MAG: glycerophosphodiester phosphodiesterase [Gammaproteobacteria bacterium]|nr:glycerophosphodiester phosphodiesterase [Gammaproteobacteria bacterium]MXZ32406.1 glycerophosphodiester phosphodiesterase [Gammaproteobacteria bacterium]MYF00008.1 glycerophosphodiester phosphodiesterase [Gammaproteobacteria bacterium]MYG96966.1 glycerophosphodiester phosphodiesterase [Gammaproteobacteria bacterium]